nr:phosphatidylserine decarboxylase [Ligilactobacillus ruminis]
MNNNPNNSFITFLYQTAAGRMFLKGIMKSGVLKAAEKYAKSESSKHLIPWFISENKIDMTEYGNYSYHSYAEFFSRQKLRKYSKTDFSDKHLISPCDGFLSAYRLSDDSSFAIKGSRYRVSDLLDDSELAKRFKNGICLVFRLEARDYHRYCYIDDCYQHDSHYIEGELHSVQPIALENYPVFSLNRRLWNLLETKNFGPIVQTEIGALLVGGFSNNHQNGHFIKGEEMGRFELHGSTITLLIEKNRIELIDNLEAAFNHEIKVRQGEWIASAINQ